MNPQSINAMRMVLLGAIIVLLLSTAYLYFQTGKFYFPGLIVTLSCLLIFIATKKKSSNDQQ